MTQRQKAIQRGKRNVSFADELAAGSRLRVSNADARAEATLHENTSRGKAGSGPNHDLLPHHQTSITAKQYKLADRESHGGDVDKAKPAG